MKLILIKLKQNQITKKRIAEALAEGFMEDPLYIHMLPKNEIRQEALEVFFKIYLDIYAKYTDIVATSDDLCSLGCIFYGTEKVKKSTFVREFIRGSLQWLDILKYVSTKQLVHMLQVIKWMSSSWMNEYTDEGYIQLNFLTVKADHRGQGKSKHILNYVITEANNKGKILVLETQNPQNIPYYEHFGFEVKHTRTYEDVIQYCMIKQPDKK